MIKCTSKCADVFCYGALRNQKSISQNKYVHEILSRKHEQDFSKLDEIPQISPHWKHNAALNLKTQNRPPAPFRGSATHPLFLQHTDPLIQHSPNPRCYYCVKQTHHSSLTEVRNYAPLFQRRERRGDTTLLRNGSSLD